MPWKLSQLWNSSENSLYLQLKNDIALLHTWHNKMSYVAWVIQIRGLSYPAPNPARVSYSSRTWRCDLIYDRATFKLCLKLPPSPLCHLQSLLLRSEKAGNFDASSASISSLNFRGKWIPLQNTSRTSHRRYTLQCKPNALKVLAKVLIYGMFHIAYTLFSWVWKSVRHAI